MGVPVFNIAVGIAAGIFMGRSFKHSGKSKEELDKETFRVSVFSAIIMGGICLAKEALIKEVLPWGLFII